MQELFKTAVWMGTLRLAEIFKFSLKEIIVFSSTRVLETFQHIIRSRKSTCEGFYSSL